MALVSTNIPFSFDLFYNARFIIAFVFFVFVDYQLTMVPHFRVLSKGLMLVGA